jgi:hypothetical protein
MGMDQVKIFYANCISLAVNDNDCLITFVAEYQDGDRVVRHEQIKVTMTPRSLKLMNQAIAQTIDQLEAMAGPIALPKPRGISQCQ